MPACSASPTQPPQSSVSLPAARRFTASTPALACSPTRAFPTERLAELQTNLILSHSAGLGDPLPRHVTRLMIVLKLLGLGRGYSGVRPLVIEALQRLLDGNAMPLIPSQGSVGASGDLAPLAHLIAALMGYGRIDLAGEIMPAAAALDRLGLEPLQLGPKEGLALINGTQASTALALDALFLGERVFAAAIAAGALSVDALKGSAKPFDPRLSELRGQPGQISVAAAIAGLLEGSEIVTSHIQCSRVQDPYSFRCQPQVMGAALDLLQNAARTLTIEAAAVTDNPIVFADEDTAISGGNFHAQPVAFAADTIAMALCEVGSISERRVSVLVDPKMSGLPAFLTQDLGVNSGLMIPQVTAAALVSENKSLAFPVSVDSIPTSAGQEDHVSMAPIAGAQGDADRSQRRRSDRGGADGRSRGHRLSRTLADLAEAAGDPRRRPRPFAALHRRPLLGGRDERASIGCAYRGNRRPPRIFPRQRSEVTRAAVARIVVSILVSAVFVAVVGELFGPRGSAVGGAIALLWLASRHDNEVGVCLPLAILFLIVIAVLCLLIYLILLTHRQ